MNWIVNKIASRAMKSERISTGLYNEAVESRKTLLANLRKSAMQELTFYYPDAIILASRHCDTLFASAPRAGKFIVGSFPDSFFPDVPNATTPEERIKAVDGFKKEVEAFLAGANAVFGRTPRGINSTQWDKYKDKGYHLHTTEADEIVEIDLRKNGESFAVSSGWTGVLPKGDLAKSIFENCIDERRNLRVATSTLSISISYDAGYSSCQVDSFGFIYHEQEKSILKNLKPIADFLNSLDDKVSVPIHLREAQDNSVSSDGAPDADDLPW